MFHYFNSTQSKFKTNWRVKAIHFFYNFTCKGYCNFRRHPFEDIKNSLGVGKVNIEGTSKIVYRVESFKELEIVINHFTKYPLVTAKVLDFLLFKQCFE